MYLGTRLVPSLLWDKFITERKEMNLYQSQKYVDLFIFSEQFI